MLHIEHRNFDLKSFSQFWITNVLCYDDTLLRFPITLILQWFYLWFRSFFLPLISICIHFILFKFTLLYFSFIIFHILRYSASYSFYIALEFMKEICGTISLFSSAFFIQSLFHFHLKMIDFHALISFMARVDTRETLPIDEVYVFVYSLLK